MEIELKLLIQPRDAKALRRSLLVHDYATGAPHQREFTTTYFDTADLLLQRHAIAWRVRQAGRQWLQAVKGGGSVEAGLHQRHEWELASTGPLPDVAALHTVLPNDGPWRKVIDKAARGGLVPVFSTRFHRTIWQLGFPDGTGVELALDQGEIRGGSVVEPISEIELELKTGDPRALFEFALALLEEVPFTVGSASKAERGYRAFAPPATTFAQPAPLVLARTTTSRGALRAIVGHCLQHMLANTAGVIAGREGESVHQMRVGLRRLRTALAVFAPLAACPGELRDEIIWLRNALASARDWDVLCEKLASMPACAPPSDTPVAAGEPVGMTALRRQAAHTARAHRRQAAAAVASPRYTRCILRIGAWLCEIAADDRFAAAHSRSIPMKAFAKKTIRQCRARLHKRSTRALAGAPDGWHRLRIAARRTRYALEFMAPMFPEKATSGRLASLMKLQDTLGRLNDLAVGTRLLAEIAATHADLAAAAAYARGAFSAESGPLAIRLRKQIRRVL